MLAILPKAMMTVFEGLGLRGGPTILSLLFRLPGLGRVGARGRLPSGEVLSFPAFDPYWGKYLHTGRAYEADVAMILARLAGLTDALFVDCGANIGYWTARSRGLGYRRAVAVEPNPNLLPYLRENVRLNGIDCVLVEAAIHDVSGTTVYLGGTTSHASAALGDAGVPVPSLTLRDAVASVRAPTYVVKLDVEGGEIAAMNAPPEGEVVYVFEDWPRGGMGVTAHALDLGLKVLGMGLDGRWVPISSVAEAISFNRATTTRYGPSNLVACRPELLPRIL